MQQTDTEMTETKKQQIQMIEAPLFHPLAVSRVCVCVCFLFGSYVRIESVEPVLSNRYHHLYQQNVVSERHFIRPYTGPIILIMDFILPNNFRTK